MPLRVSATTAVSLPPLLCLSHRFGNGQAAQVAERLFCSSVELYRDNRVPISSQALFDKCSGIS